MIRFLSRRAARRYSVLMALILLCLFILTAASAQAGDSARGDRITRYDIHLTIPDSYSCMHVAAELSIERAYPQAPGSLVLTVGRNFKGAEVKAVSVADGRGKPLPFSRKGDTLSLTVPGERAGKGTLTVRITYDLVKTQPQKDDPYASFAFEIGKDFCHINGAITRTDNWYPRLESPPALRLPPYRLTINAPAHLEVMASGELMGRTTEGNRAVTTWRNYGGLIDRTLWLYAREAEKITRTYDDGFTVDIWAPKTHRQQNITALADVIHRSYCYFEEAFGPSPARRYRIMAFPHGWSGLCNAMTAPESLFTEPIVNNEIGFPLRTVIHEVSHTWWGNMVAADAATDYWLFEGFGKYSEIVAMNAALGINAEEESFRRLKVFSMPYLGAAPPVMKANLAEERILQSVSAYYHGALFLHMLEYMMGREQFGRAIRRYVTLYRGKVATTDDLRRAMEPYASEKLKEYFDDYLTRPGFARYSTANVSARAKLDGDGRLIDIYTTTLLHNRGDKAICSECMMRDGETVVYQKLMVAKGAGCTFTVEGSDPIGQGSLKIDGRDQFPLCEEGITGCGGMAVYEGKEIRFREVVRDTPLSRAGIQNGMVLVTIDGALPPEGDVCRLNMLLQRPRGSRMKLMVRAGEQKPLEVVVKY